MITQSLPLWILDAFITGLGLLFGSFFNVCIYRLPRDLGVARGRSFCPHCQKTIPWYANLPVLSYVALRARCIHCAGKISWEYPLIEILTAVLFWAMWHLYGPTWQFVAYTLFTSSLLVLTVIDIHHRIIPDEISLGGIIVGFLFQFLTHDISWIDSLIGILLGGGFFLAIAWGYEKWKGVEGLGGGDVKLLGMIGAWLGYQSLLTTIIVSSCAGSVIGIVAMLLQKKDMQSAIPFGPFLALGAMVYLLFGDIVTGFLIAH